MICGALILLAGLAIGVVAGICFMAAWYGGINQGIRSRKSHPVDVAKDLADEAFGKENVDQDSFDHAKRETLN